MVIETKILIQRHDSLGTIPMESATNFMITQHLLIDKSSNSFTREWFIEKQRQESASTEFIKWKDNLPNIALYI